MTNRRFTEALEKSAKATERLAAAEEKAVPLYLDWLFGRKKRRDKPPVNPAAPQMPTESTPPKPSKKGK
jgi:hypothetical protein